MISLSLLSYVKYLPYAIVFAVGFGGAWKLQNQIWEGRQAEALSSLESRLRGECIDNQKITEGVSNEYQTKIADLNRRVANLKRMRTANCNVQLADAAGGGNAETGKLVYRHDGIPFDSLIEYAASAEEVGLRLDACQAFIQKTWAARGQ